MKQMLRKSMMAALLFSSAAIFGADAIWSGTVTDVTNGNISIQTNSTVVNTKTVTVTDNNYTVTLDQSITLFADFTSGGTLVLNVAAPHILTFDLSTYDLSLSGSGSQSLELLISGSGQVNFALGGGRTVSFTAPDTVSAGTKVYVDMRADGIDVRFTRTDGDPTSNVTVAIGHDSLITYVSDAAVGAVTPSGTVGFYPTYAPAGAGIGRMVLSLADKAGFIIASQSIDGSNVVDLAAPAGGTPVCFVSSEGVVTAQPPSLFVINSNQTLGQYLYNPWNIQPNPFTGVRYGFVLGNDAELAIDENTYFDYVGLAPNVCPNPPYANVETLVKERNPSALIVDGYVTGTATISLGECSGMYFRSGVDASGVVEFPLGSEFEFTVTTALSEGAGEIVFDVEGPLNIEGAGTCASRLELLSLMVTPTGLTLFSDPVCSSCVETIFPRRTFDVDSAGDYRVYNKGAFMINNVLALHETTLAHTDVNHLVLEKNDVLSEPTYIGGDVVNFSTTIEPKLLFDNSALLVRENIALTGVDLLVAYNTSVFTFFYNGYCLDDGTGRQMVLGTCIGAYACDGSTLIDPQAHFDIIQQSASTADAHISLQVAPNVATYNPAITTPVNASQKSIHTIYLGHASNITIGSYDPTFDATTWPDATLSIDGEFFSFETRGGIANSPMTSNVTGQGGMFVDGNGIVTIQRTPRLRTNVAMMITKSHNGSIDLPRNQVFYDLTVGVSDWQLDLATTQTVIPFGMCLSDYSLDWLNVKKNCPLFEPYPVMVMEPCSTQTVIPANILDIPVVQGLVDQFQVLGSRLGSPVHLKIDGGRIRELVFFNTNHSAEIPTGVIVVQNNGRVGLGTANRNADSVDTVGFLGANGITIIANGSGTVDVNSDLVINNVCHILKGPDFTSTDSLTFFSETGKQIILKSCGVLDITTFDNGGNIVFGGNVQLVCEAGAHIELGQSGAALVFKDNAIMRDFSDATQTYGCAECTPEGTPGTITATDARRIKIAGTGALEFRDNSLFEIDDEAIFGIESSASAACSKVTNVTIRVLDNAQFLVAPKDGGSLQIGNTTDVAGADVSYTLSIDQRGMVQIGPRGFMGHALGIVSKEANQQHNDWLVDNLFNVTTITFDFISGAFRHAMIYPGSSVYAGLFGIGDRSSSETFVLNMAAPQSEPGSQYDLYSQLGFRLNGGGNIYLKTSNSGPVAPVVENTDEFLEAGIMKSYAMFSFPLLNPFSPSSFFAEMQALSVCDKNMGAISGGLSLGYDGGAVGAEGESNYKMRVGYIDFFGAIRRQWISQIVAGGALTGITTRFAHEQQVGAVFVTLNASTGNLFYATEYKAN